MATVMQSFDEELPILARHADELVLTSLMLPQLEYIEMMSDKLLMIEALIKRGIAAPYYCLFAR